MSVMLLIPSYEPQTKVISFVRKLSEQTRKNILIVDDGSGSDYQSTFKKLATSPSVSILSYSKNKGKGVALKTGFQKIVTDYPEVTAVVTADSDGQHSIADIERMIRAVEQADARTLVLGTRSFKRAETPVKSYWGNRISSIFFYFVTGTKCGDTQTGLRAIRRELLPELLSVEGERFEYEMNVLLKSRELAIRLEQLPIETIYEENNAHSHFRAIQDSYRIYKPLFRYLSSALLSLSVDFLVFLFLLSWLGESNEMTVLATIIARLLSGIVNYTLARSWVFENKDRVYTTLWKYSLLFLVQMGLSSLGVLLLLSILPSALLSKLIVDSILFVLSFIVQNRVIFQKDKVSR